MDNWLSHVIDRASGCIKSVAARATPMASSAIADLGLKEARGAASDPPADMPSPGLTGRFLIVASRAGTGQSVHESRAQSIWWRNAKSRGPDPPRPVTFLNEPALISVGRS